jgi:hypothetical protein
MLIILKSPSLILVSVFMKKIKKKFEKSFGKKMRAKRIEKAMEWD